jgi:hypothetical protein
MDALLTGIYMDGCNGWIHCSQGELWSWTLFFAGVTAVGVGSTYYHLNPDNATLVWDRLPVSLS